MEHAEYERMIEEQVMGELRSARVERLHEHLRECQPCARVYQRCVDAERALCGTPELSVLQRDRSGITRAVFRSLGVE